MLNFLFHAALKYIADKKYAEQFIKEKNRQRERDAKLMEIEPEKLKARYKLDELGDRDIETMDMIGYKRGFVTGRKELDYTRIATTVLNEFRDGKIGKISLEVPEDIK